MSAAPLNSGRALWWRWTLYTAAGELTGFAVPAIVGPLAVQALTGLPVLPRTLAVAALVVLAGIVEGAALGTGQWLVLRRPLPSIPYHTWVRPTALAAGLAYILGLAPNALGDLGASMGTVIAAWVVLGTLLLFTIGSAQWLVLRRHVHRAGLWVPANALAWLAGLPFPFITIAAVPDGSAISAFILAGILGGLLMGLAVGAVTGWALLRILQAQSQD